MTAKRDRRDGWLVIQAVNRNGYKRRFKEMLKPAKRDEDTGTFSVQEVLRMVAKAGFQVQRVEGYNWPPLWADSRRLSDTRLAGISGRLESALSLKRFINLSPWLLIAAKKQTPA